MLSQLQVDVEKLAAPGSRKVGSSGHDKAVEYLKERMLGSGLEPYLEQSYELSYQVELTLYTNLAGVRPGLDRTLKPILLVAHYDTCGDQPGADDNAAAIAIWFEVLEALKTINLQRDIIILFPDAEEPPRFLSEHMGSTKFYEKQLQNPIHAGLVLDLVGHDIPLEGFEELLFIFGAESHQELAEILTETKPPDGLKNIATLNRYVGDLSDHHVLRKHGEPYLFFTCGRWEHYHQQSDIPENLNYAKMARISQYLVGMIEALDSRGLMETSAEYDPVNMELYLLKRALGPYLDQQDIAIENREDIQKFVLNWIKQHQL
ncbi:MAG: M28 family peptidase [FCB group bacterium]|nr:M28 family peptidase [FCB group bacterium]MBL7028994.1 M28 family peptidase [Candidatus Neomarinimicrobiota bacterium]MBL7123183.1 M28 family peptidase [Candidatus Neomarinimicrobiota bacterium]